MYVPSTLYCDVGGCGRPATLHLPADWALTFCTVHRALYLSAWLAYAQHWGIG